ncbi:MAG TPA: hypothetical protein GX394_03795 [Clostridiales bacterium]|nr:hypothetical protein [Clostridiales bacterium]
MYRVACLEWNGRIKDRIDVHRAHELRFLPYEILSAKEARNWFGLLRKAPRLPIMGWVGDYSVVLWRSSFIVGDTVRIRLKGNRFFGDEKYGFGKSYWTKAAKFIQFITTRLLFLGSYIEILRSKEMRGFGLPKSISTKKKNDKSKNHWVLKIFFVTFVISIVFSIVSQKTFSSSANFLLPLSIIFIIILIGVIFDIIGIAVTSTPETPFLSMSSKKIKGAKQALNLVKNADIVSNFCNDVVGDICGIVSGAAGSMLVVKMVRVGFNPDMLTILISSLIAAITVAGKAMGKSLAINKGQQIVYSVGYLLSFFSANSSSKDKNNRITKRKEMK